MQHHADTVQVTQMSEPATPKWRNAEHQHVYSALDLCTIDGCDVMKPTWVGEAERHAKADSGPAVTSVGRFSWFRSLPTPAKFAAVLVFTLTVLHFAAPAVNGVVNKDQSAPRDPIVVYVK